MYYPQQSPGIAQKLPQHPAQLHDQSPWARTTHHSVLAPPNHAQQPTSPAYPLFTHANSTMSVMQHHPVPHMSAPMSHHHHQNSLSHPHFQSPPNGNGLPGSHNGLVQNGSPGNGVVTQTITQHWQTQLLKCEVRVLCSFVPFIRSLIIFRMSVPHDLHITVRGQVRWLLERNPKRQFQFRTPMRSNRQSPTVPQQQHRQLSQMRQNLLHQRLPAALKVHLQLLQPPQLSITPRLRWHLSRRLHVPQR